MLISTCFSPHLVVEPFGALFAVVHARLEVADHVTLQVLAVTGYMLTDGAIGRVVFVYEHVGAALCNLCFRCCIGTVDSGRAFRSQQYIPPDCL